MQKEDKYKVILFYKFINLENPELIMKNQRALCEKIGLKGRMILAREGVNATFEGTESQVEKYKEMMSQDSLFSDIKFKESEGSGKAFTKLQIKVRPEIVTLGATGFDVKNETAKEVTADELDVMYKNDEDFVVLDLRNDYEIKAGYFDKTLNPKLKNFRDLKDKLKELGTLKDKKVVTVCTGGIRCEKATCLMKREGFDNLYQLKDGIHTYMQKYPGKNFKGSLFVFDNRMVTPVVDVPEREIVGECIYCGIKSEEFYSDDSQRPSKKVICCNTCARSNMSHLRKCA